MTSWLDPYDAAHARGARQHSLAGAVEVGRLIDNGVVCRCHETNPCPGTVWRDPDYLTRWWKEHDTLTAELAARQFRLRDLWRQLWGWGR